MYKKYTNNNNHSTFLMSLVLLDTMHIEDKILNLNLLLLSQHSKCIMGYIPLNIKASQSGCNSWCYLHTYTFLKGSGSLIYCKWGATCINVLHFLSSVLQYNSLHILHSSHNIVMLAFFVCCILAENESVFGFLSLWDSQLMFFTSTLSKYLAET